MSCRVGIAGGGAGVRLHVPVLQELGCVTVRIELPHLSDDPDKASDTSPSVTIPTEWVVVATPPFAHLSHVGTVLAAGARVVCEKPVGPTAETAVKLLARYADAGEVLVNHQLRFYPPVVHRASEMRTSETIEFRYESAARAAGNVPPWYYRSTLGGGVLYSIGSHLIDLVHAVGRRFRVIRATASDQLEARPGDALNRFQAEGLLTDGGLVRMRVDGLARAARFGLGLTTRDTTEWLDFITGQPTPILSPQPLTDSQGQATLSSRAARPWRLAQREFYRQLFDAPGQTEGTRQAARLADAIRTHLVIDACKQSIRENGSAVSVNPMPRATHAL